MKTIEVLGSPEDTNINLLDRLTTDPNCLKEASQNYRKWAFKKTPVVKKGSLLESALYEDED